MNIHIIINEKFTPRFIDFLKIHYPQKSNMVYVYGKKWDCVKIESEFVKKVDLSYKNIDLTLVKKATDKIFIHSFYDKKLLRFLFINRNKIDFSKVVFIAWGADIYNDRYSLAKPATNLRNCCSRLISRIHKHIKQMLMKKVKLYMTFACADINIIRYYYNADGIQFDCLYPSTINIQALTELKKTCNNNSSKTKRILLGNSASITNQHIKALEILSKFSNENIEIVCPLSYGDKNYTKKVIEVGKKYFNEKFKPITEFMSPQEYASFLNSVDIAIFNNNRQEATGNIEILGYLGKKIYLRSDVTTWDHYVIRDKCSFFDTKQIQNMTFDEFCFNDSQSQSINEKYFSKIWNDNYVKELWDKIMNFQWDSIDQ